jgi:hypothetical protein
MIQGRLDDDEESSVGGVCGGTSAVVLDDGVGSVGVADGVSEGVSPVEAPYSGPAILSPATATSMVSGTPPAGASPEATPRLATM